MTIFSMFSHILQQWEKRTKMTYNFCVIYINW